MNMTWRIAQTELHKEGERMVKQYSYFVAVIIDSHVHICNRLLLQSPKDLKQHLAGHYVFSNLG
jgi:hypothetical protein